MDSSVTTFKPTTQLQDPNAELHSIISQKSSKRRCVLRRRAFKRQSKLLSKLERDFQSLLSFFPTTESDPKSTRNPDPKLEVQLVCSIKCQEFLRSEIFDGEGGEGESYEFFRGLFEKDETLTKIYVNDSAIHMLLCLVCDGEKKRKIYGSCLGLVQHACTVEKTKKIGAHRAFGRVVCEILGWDVNEYLNICKSKVGDKWIKFKKKKVSIIHYRSNLQHSDVATMCYNPRSPYLQVMPVDKSCSGMELDKNDFQMDTDNIDESKGYDKIVEKIEGLSFNANFSAAECKTFPSSASFDGTNAGSFLQTMCTVGSSTTSYFRALGPPTVGQCIEKLKSLHGLCPGIGLYNFACYLMCSETNREIFMELEDDTARYTWLEFNYNKDGQF